MTASSITILPEKFPGGTEARDQEAGSPGEGRAGLQTACSAETQGMTVKESVNPPSELSPA